MGTLGTGIAEPDAIGDGAGVATPRLGEALGTVPGWAPVAGAASGSTHASNPTASSVTPAAMSSGARIRSSRRAAVRTGRCYGGRTADHLDGPSSESPRAHAFAPAGDAPSVHSMRMRGPLAVGILAGLLVALVAVGAFVGLALRAPGDVSESPVPSTPGPTLPPASAASPAPSPAPSATREPGASASPEPSPSRGVGSRPGDLAPPLRVAQLGGGTMDLAALRGRPVWVNFMATWCPPCREELPLLERFQARLGERMTILLVDVEEDEDVVATFMTSLGVDLPVGLDRDGTAREAWGAAALPVHLWVDADGVVRASVFGGAPPPAFEEATRTILPHFRLEP
jgi:thiol-disulfide isomerase/thioredoxin